MSFSESPVETDIEIVKAKLNQALEELAVVNSRLDQYRDAINAIGQNIQWIVEHTQGIFQMFSNPAVVNQMMGQVLGGGMIPGGTGPEEH